MELMALLAKAKDGTLAPEELQHAVRMVEVRDASDGDLYTALHIVGIAGNSSMVDFVIPYLDAAHDPMLARLALQVLCRYWGLAERFIDRIRDFMLGVEWDEANDVRQVAISLAGQYLRDGNVAGELTEILVQIASDPTDDILREDATRALAMAMGDDLNSIPATVVGTSSDSHWSTDVMSRACAIFGIT